jgi:uncharacterized protein YidB (DUF937 family)
VTAEAAAAEAAAAAAPVSVDLVREIYKMGAQLGAAMQQQQQQVGGLLGSAADPPAAGGSSTGLTAALEAVCLRLFQGDVSAMMQHMTAAVGQE